MREHFDVEHAARRRRAPRHHRREGQALEERHGQGHVREAPRQREEERRGGRAAPRRDDREARVVTAPGRAPDAEARTASSSPPSGSAAHLGDARDLRVVDVRGKVLPPGSKPRYLAKRGDYDAAHVPGAVFVDWTRDIVDPDDPVPVQVARARGVRGEDGRARHRRRGTLVVAYDDYDHIFAGRLAWALRYYGHDAVRVLDGGWARWVAEGRPTTTARAPRPAAARFTPRRARGAPSHRRRGRARAREARRAPHRRAPARAIRRARSAPPSRGGHIPGARNVPYARLVDPQTGALLAAERAVAAPSREAGVDVAHLPREVVVYCNGGVSCTVPLHALRHARPRRRGGLRRLVERVGRRRVAADQGRSHAVADSRAFVEPARAPGCAVRQRTSACHGAQRAPTLGER